MSAESEIGIEMAARLAHGDFVPDDVVLAVVCEAVTAACESGGGYILDGFPHAPLS